MGVRVSVNWTGARAIPSRLDEGLNMAANQALANMEQFVPKSENYLRESGHVSGHSILYKKPYAKAQFYGGYKTKKGKKVTYHNYTTPGTGKRWDLRLKGDQQLMKTVTHAFAKGAGF